MAKTNGYTWRVDPATKAALEDVARERRVSVAAVLEEIVTEWLSQRENEVEEQRRLHDAASRYVGVIAGTNSERAATSRELVRERLRRQRRFRTAPQR
jgi:hypothetical protein